MRVIFEESTRSDVFFLENYMRSRIQIAEASQAVFLASKQQLFDKERLLELISTEKMEKLAAEIKDSFLLEESVGEIASSDFFTGYFAGISLSDESLSIDVRRKISIILLEGLVNMILSAEDERSDTAVGLAELNKDSATLSKISLKEYREFAAVTEPNVERAVFLWGLEVAVFVVLNTDFGSEEPEVLDKALMISRAVRWNSMIMDNMEDSPLQTVYVATMDFEVPLLWYALLENQTIPFEDLLPLMKPNPLERLHHAPLALLSSLEADDAKTQPRAVEIVEKLLLMDRQSLIVAHTREFRRGVFDRMVKCFVVRTAHAGKAEVLHQYIRSTSGRVLSGYGAIMIGKAIIDLKLDKEKVDDFLSFLLKEGDQDLALLGMWLAAHYKIDKHDSFKKLCAEKYRDFDFLDEDFMELFMKEIVADEATVMHPHSKGERTFGQWHDRFGKILGSIDELAKPGFHVHRELSHAVMGDYSRVPLKEIAFDTYVRPGAEETTERLKSLVERFPYNFEFHNMLAQHQYSQEDYEEAFRVLENGNKRLREVLRIPDDRELLLLSAQNSSSNKEIMELLREYLDELIDRREFGTARMVIEDMSPRLVDDDRMLFNKLHGRLLAKTRDFRKLGELIDGIDLEEVENVELLIQSAISSYVKKNLEDAESLMLSALDKNPYLIKALFGELTADAVDDENITDESSGGFKILDALALASTYKGIWNSFSTGKIWLRKVQQLRDEIA